MIGAPQDAKKNISEVERQARTEGAQVVTLPGENAAVVAFAEEDAKRLSHCPSIVDHILSGPAWDDDFIATVSGRSKAPSRPDPL